MFDFISSHVAALQSNDYLAFATAYNGPANAQTYHDIIQHNSRLYDQLIVLAH